MAHLKELLIEEMQDLLHAETQLTGALPKMAEAAHSPDLRSAFQTHLRETEGHVVRLERIFSKLGRSPERETCAAMKGLIAEGEEMIGAKGDPSGATAAYGKALLALKVKAAVAQIRRAETSIN